jgi:hypothetical protein
MVVPKKKPKALIATKKKSNALVYNFQKRIPVDIADNPIDITSIQI